MAQNEKPNVDALFARMFGGTKPVEDNLGGEDREENPPAKKTAANRLQRQRKRYSLSRRRLLSLRRLLSRLLRSQPRRPSGGGSLLPSRKSGILVVRRSTVMGEYMSRIGLTHGS